MVTGSGNEPLESIENSPVSSAKPAKPSYDEQIATVLTQFISSIDGLSMCFPVTRTAIAKVAEQSTTEFTEFIKHRAIHVEKPDTSQPDKTTLTFTIEEHDEAEINLLTRKWLRATKATHLVPRSLFVSLVSAYDQFLGELIKTLLLLKPEILTGSDKSMKFSDLVQFDSIESARNFIVEKEIEAVLRGSHSEHFKWLESKFSIPLQKGLTVWSEFIEVTERRNLFVHAGGVISGQYLSVCNENKFDISALKKGEQLSVSTKYFDRAYEVLFELGVKLTQVLWRKLLPDSLSKADQNMLGITYTLISEERYNLATVLLDFAVDVLKKHSSEDLRLRLVINRAQAYKWSGDDAKAKAQIQAEDLSAARPIFKLASAAILDELSESIDLVKQLGPHSDIGIKELREWPLFKRLREAPEFIKAVEDVYEEPLLRKDVDAKVTALISDQNNHALDAEADT